jgi:hypothetical protein
MNKQFLLHGMHLQEEGIRESIRERNRVEQQEEQL